MEELAAWNAKLYEDILPDVYDRSYGNPAYATEKLGAEYGPVLSALYAEIRGAIAYVYEQKIEYLDILFELFVEIYNQFEEGPVVKMCRIQFIGMQAITATYLWQTES